MKKTTELAKQIADNQWFEDIYLNSQRKCYYYRLMFILLTLFILLLMMALIYTCVHKTVQVIVVHHNAEGVTWVSLKQNKPSDHQEAQRSLDEVHSYIEMRENVIPLVDYVYFNQVDLMSDGQASLEFIAGHKAKIEYLKHGDQQTVKIIHLMPMDAYFHQASHGHTVHLTQADVIITHWHHQQIVKKYHASIVLAWYHRGWPQDPQTQQLNWDGFTVIEYQKTINNKGL